MRFIRCSNEAHLKLIEAQLKQMDAHQAQGMLIDAHLSSGDAQYTFMNAH
jgi:hypothetical protein